MSLEDFADNDRTDKNTLHSYLPLYNKLLFGKKQTAINVLEVGIRDGGSIKLWHDYFTTATIHGIDTMRKDDIWDELKNNSRIILHTSSDAYNPNFFKEAFLDKGLKFDMLLDDGPHTLESMIYFIQLYSQVMTDDGILVIEDVQSMDWLPVLEQYTPDHLKPYIQMYDLRPNKNRYDDIVFTINKSVSPRSY